MAGFTSTRVLLGSAALDGPGGGDRGAHLHVGGVELRGSHIHVSFLDDQVAFRVTKAEVRRAP